MATASSRRSRCACTFATRHCSVGLSGRSPGAALRPLRAFGPSLLPVDGARVGAGGGRPPGRRVGPDRRDRCPRRRAGARDAQQVRRLLRGARRMSLDLPPRLPPPVSTTCRSQACALLEALEGDQHAPTAVQRARPGGLRAPRGFAGGAGACCGSRGAPHRGPRFRGRVSRPRAGHSTAIGGRRARREPAAQVRVPRTRHRAPPEIANARVVVLACRGLGGGPAAQDLVTARALAPQPVVLEYAAPLLRRGGTSCGLARSRRPGRGARGGSGGRRARHEPAGGPPRLSPFPALATAICMSS